MWPMNAGSIFKPVPYCDTFQALERMSKDFSPEADFASRHITKDDFPGRYPYRDFGLMYWEATHTWVKEYLDVSEGRVLCFAVCWCS